MSVGLLHDAAVTGESHDIRTLNYDDRALKSLDGLHHYECLERVCNTVCCHSVLDVDAHKQTVTMYAQACFKASVA